MTNPTSKKWSVLSILFLFPLLVFADDLPTDDEIDLLAQKARQTAGDFYENTFEIRMRYEYAGRFLDPNDKVKLLELSVQAAADLEKIAQDQNNLKKQIEDYQGDDWEIKFGQTGLWRNLDYAVCETSFNKLQIQYYQALSSQLKTGTELLRNIARQTASLCSKVNVVDPNLLKIRALVALALIDPNEKASALKEFEVFQYNSDIEYQALAEIEKIRLLGETSPEKLDFIEKFCGSSRSGLYIESCFSLMILRHKYDPNSFEKRLNAFPETRSILGKLILSDISSQDLNKENLNNCTTLDADMVAYAAWITNPVLYKELLLSFADIDRLKTPMVLYAAGRAVAETEPQKTIQFFIESSTLQLQKKEPLINIDAKATAEEAARLAYNNFTKQNIDCNLAVAAFDNYKLIVSDKMSEEMQFNYGKILLDCGKTQNAIETFTKLAQTSQSVWRDKANFQLLKIYIDAGNLQPLSQLRKLILDCNGNDELRDQLRFEAMNLYCRTALARDNNDSAMQVLDILNSAEQTRDFPYDLYQAQANFNLGRLEEAAWFMSKAINANYNSPPQQVVLLLSEILDKIELCQQNARDFNEMLRNCDNLAQFTYSSLNDRQTAVILAEISILEGEKVSLGNENDTSWMRPKARLLMVQGNFEQSSRLWTKIAELRSSDEKSPNRKSYGWWQAKYYELECMSKLPSANLKDIQHAIEVLQSTYNDIPIPWAEKFKQLKQYQSESSK
jgi:hypothetical protein